MLRHIRLSRIYEDTGRLDLAIQELEGLIKVNKRNGRTEKGNKRKARVSGAY